MEVLKSTKELRKVQSILGEKSFSIVLPKHIATEIGINKGDYLEFYKDGNRIVLQKAVFQHG
jgi:AbrB family looped-hinge helix DNA binding protein